MGEERKPEDKELHPSYVLTPTYYPPYEETDQISILSYVNVLLKRRWLIVLMFLVAVLSAYITSRQQTKYYKAIATFLFAERFPGSVMGEASTSPFQDPIGYYKQIAVSSPILDRLLKEKFPDRNTGKAASLLEIWKVKGDTEEERLYNGRKTLEASIELTSERNLANIVKLTVTAASPQLAAMLANRTIELLRQYDIELKTANAEHRIRFIESRVTEAEEKLKTAEDKLQKFQESNRVLSTPLLAIEKNRLDREISLHTEIFITLKKELELARIAEKKEASAISVIDKATPPRLAFKPKTRTNVILAGVVGLMLAVGLAFVLEYVSSFGSGSEEGREFARNWEEAKADLRRLLFLGRNKKAEPAPSSLSQESAKYP
ncbi:hypothetical protein MYX75_01765 [Acidobacteria bacterium AH-259-A15]|nr:hypothetical protein [Acidobacteria bacterium AH-259-A15]